MTELEKLIYESKQNKAVERNVVILFTFVILICVSFMMVTSFKDAIECKKSVGLYSCKRDTITIINQYEYGGKK